MKIKPEEILFDKSETIKGEVFLITGNEDTLIKKITSEIISRLKLNNFGELKKIKNLEKEDVETVESSLFDDKKIILVEEPKNIDTKYIDNMNFEKERLVIQSNNKKLNKDVKNYFEKHKTHKIISCFKIVNKKNFVDLLLNKYDVSLSKDAYWYFLDNISEQYQLIENEILKLNNVGNEIIEISDIRLLISRPEELGVEELFFVIISDSKEILKKSASIITSPSIAYFFLNRVIFFLDIMLKSNNASELDNNFPRYLFKEKIRFLKISKNMEGGKIIKVLEMIKKSELLIRKNNKMYLIVIQRLLLNLKKQFQ